MQQKYALAHCDHVCFATNSHIIIIFLGLAAGAQYDWDQQPEAHTERENEVLSRTSFYPKYLGSTLVEELVNPEPGANYHNTGLSTKALDRIVRMVSFA